MKKEEYISLNASTGGFAYSLMIILYLIISVLGQAILSLIGVNTVINSAISATFSAFAITIAVFLVKSKTGDRLTELCSIKKFNSLFILLSLLFSFGMFCGLGFVNTSIAEILKGWGLNYPSISFPLERPLHLVVFSVAFAMLPALFEEVFFRGILLNSVKGGKVVFSAIVVSLFFAIYHCSIVQLVYQFVYGIGLYFITKLSKSVFPAIISHFLNNFAVIFLQYFKVSVDLFNGFIIASGILGLIIFTMICYSLVKKGKGNKTKTSVKPFIFPYGFIGLLACVLLIVSALF